jgi:allophanate hydrolase subunit 1
MYQLVVLRQQQAIELRKEQDINEEYALRQMQKKKAISSLPNADILEASLSSKRVAIDLLTSEIDEVEVSSRLPRYLNPFHERDHPSFICTARA